jgi:hypothetical protein
VAVIELLARLVLRSRAVMHSGLQFGLQPSHESPCPLWGRSFDSGRYTMLDWIAEHLPAVPVNVMAQCHPDNFCDPTSAKYRDKYAEIARRPTHAELDRSCAVRANWVSSSRPPLSSATMPLTCRRCSKSDGRRNQAKNAALTEDGMANTLRALLVTKDGDQQSVAVTELSH